MRVDREALLASLEAVAPGLANRETIEQSDCFVFQDGMVRTFNEEIACTMPVKLDGAYGAVSAKPMLDALRQMEDEWLMVFTEGPQLILKGRKGRGLKMKLSADIKLPLSAIELPETWKEIAPEYGDALLMVHECAKEKDEERFNATCVHVARGRIEATDNSTQMMRYTVKTGIKTPSLLKKRSARHVAEMGAREFAETERWLHYRNDAGLVVSCCRYIEDYPDTTPHCVVEGTQIVLPKSLAEAASIAEVFSREQKDANFLVLTLAPGKIKVEGIGITGEYSHPVACQYDGPAMSFMIPPKLLKQVVEKYDTATINPSRLFVQGENFCYVTRLRDPSILKPKKGKKGGAEE